MQALFVHGMGRSPLSGWPLLRQLRRAGLSTSTFGYVVTWQCFTGIRDRLADRIAALAEQGSYIVIGHSLGGVLLRAAVNCLPPGTLRPSHMFFLGMPVQPSRFARRLADNPLFRVLTNDCGRLLGSTERMAQVPPPQSPATAIVGVRGFPARVSPFGGEPNDGVVSVSEVSADWLPDQVRIREIHTLLPASRRVAQIILERLIR